MIGHRMIWWPLVPGSVIAGIALSFFSSPLRLTDFYPFTHLSAWGWPSWPGEMGARLIGLIIPGALLIGIGPGIALAWGDAIAHEGRLTIGASLSQTGVMLVCFALGWVLDHGFIPICHL